MHLYVYVNVLNKQSLGKDMSGVDSDNIQANIIALDHVER